MMKAMRWVVGGVMLGLAVAVTAPASDGLRTPRWEVGMDTSSLETLLLHPESVRDDPDAFWANDAAYVLAKSWHDNNHISLDTRDYYRKWLEGLDELAAVPEAEREANEAFALLEDIRDREPVFQERGVALLDEMLPRNNLEFATTIYITTKTFPFGIMTSGMIVCDVLSPYYKGDPDRIWNVLTHECYHIGYGWNRNLRQEDELDDGFLYHTMLDGLQNEGLATYLGYQARAFFPADDVEDYRLLDDPAEVDRLRAALNGVFALVGEVPEDSLRSTAWDVGVTQRGYYAVGAHMARTIDERLGREALLETIAVGPVDFVDTYNGLVGEPERVVFGGGSAEPSALSRLKTATVKGNRAAFDAAAAEMTAGRANLHPETRRRLERFGYAMLRQDAFDWAVPLFELDVALFPDEPNAYDSLAEAHLKSGNRDEAIRFYKKALEVDPGFENAKKMLEEIEAGS